MLFRSAVVEKDCTAIRGTLDKWLAFAPIDSTSGSDDIVPLLYVEPILRRVDLLCPKLPPAKHGKRPAKPKHAQ